MSILIEGMKMPKEPDEMIEIAIFGDGKVIQTGESWRSLTDKRCYYTTTTPEKHFHARQLPPHGRLIDADMLEKLYEEQRDYFWHWLDKSENPASEAMGYGINWCINTLHDNAITVIPGDEET